MYWNKNHSLQGCRSQKAKVIHVFVCLSLSSFTSEITGLAVVDKVMIGNVLSVERDMLDRLKLTICGY